MIVSNTGFTSAGKLERTLNMSAVARCCSRASASSHLYLSSCCSRSARGLRIRPAPVLPFVPVERRPRVALFAPLRDKVTSSAMASIQCSEDEALGTLTEKLNLRRAEPDEVLRRDGNRPIDAEDSNLEFVSRLDRIRQHHSIGHVEALDRGRAGIAAAARHLPVDPDFRVVVDIGRKHGFCGDRFEIADLRRYRQHRTVPMND